MVRGWCLSPSINKNIIDYIRRKRIELAKELLINEPNSNLQDIAIKVGYDNVARFIRNFKQMSGETPGSFRNRKKI
jgi:AraC-like DNA-binding protein